MSQQINMENFKEAKYDVFKMFSEQWGILTCGEPGDFRCMTIGWGMMGNLWGHPGSSLTVYVQPSRHTFEYMMDKDHFAVCFLPEEYREDATILGTKSSRDGDKVALTRLTPVALEHGVGFEQSQLTFVCRKVCAQQFDINAVPDHMREGMYSRLEPHYFFIGVVEDVFGTVES